MVGLGVLLQGAGLVLRRGRLFGLGLIPPLLTSVAFLTAFVSVVWQAPVIATATTPFVEGWDSAEVIRGLAAAGVVLASGLLLVLLFSTITLTLGAPLYDRISESIDAQAGTFLRQPDPGPVAGLALAVRRVLTTLAITVPVGLCLLLIGLVPVAGPLVATIGSAMFGGWMVALDIIGSAADRRGFRTLAARHGLLKRNRWLALGFGVPTFLLMSIPFVAVLAFPVATAGATLLTRRLVAQA